MVFLTFANHIKTIQHDKYYHKQILKLTKNVLRNMSVFFKAAQFSHTLLFIVLSMIKNDKNQEKVIHC